MATTTTDKKKPDERAVLAEAAQAKAKPAARISKTNIAAVQKRLGGKKPSEVLGVSPALLAQLATGKKRKGQLGDEQKKKLDEFAKPLAADTFYGRKLAGMLWAIEQGPKA